MQDLYRQIVLDRYRQPRHRRPLPNANASAYINNPLCGDELTVSVRLDGELLAEAAFDAHGCSISQASADLMIDAVEGKTLTEVETLMRAFEVLLSADDDAEAVPELGEAHVLRAVRQYPVRVKCALLAWETLRSALAQKTGDPSHL